MVEELFVFIADILIKQFIVFCAVMAFESMIIRFQPQYSKVLLYASIIYSILNTILLYLSLRNLETAALLIEIILGFLGYSICWIGCVLLLKLNKRKGSSNEK